MSEEVKPASSAVKGLPSILESFAELRFLLLLLCTAFYLDCWFIGTEIDPTKLSLANAYKSILLVPVFDVMLFIVSYSLLMVGFFPTIRKIIAIISLYCRGTIGIGNTTKESIQLSNWSAAFVCLSAYNGIVGYFLSDDSYSGLASYIFNVLQADGFGEAIFRICAMFFWLYCLSLALEFDDLNYNE
ncbi:hypothetical protein ACA895_004177 [Vibrio vulnificus]|nr:hypothetical protein [Vibrio cholerae]ELI0612393.1 hypothetical protein [Vibrio vulnificus]MCU8273637.1 hypothetical protein [Vibrio vulnificus]HDY7479532.1 hypothetical protein [Vibrio vulnificus]